MKYIIEGLNCGHCAAKIETEIKKLPGLEQAVLVFATKSINFPEEFEQEVQQILDRVEPGARLVSDAPTRNHTSEKAEVSHNWKDWISPIFAGAMLLLGVIFQFVLSSSFLVLRS